MTQDSKMSFKWAFPFLGGVSHDYDIETFTELLDQMEDRYVSMFATRLGIDPKWRPVQDEKLSPEKVVISRLIRNFRDFRTIAAQLPFTEENVYIFIDIVDRMQAMVAWASDEARLEAVDITISILQQKFRGLVDKEKLTKRKALQKVREVIRDSQKALVKQHDMWFEERYRREWLERKDLLTTRENGQLVIRSEKELFASVVLSAKRTKGGKLIFSDIARLCKKEFPNGIAGRKIDDKFAKELCEKLELK